MDRMKAPLGDLVDLFGSSLSLKEKIGVRKITKIRETTILYVTPEQIINNENALVLIQSGLPISLPAVIDEDHYVSEWGHGFRPDFSKLSINYQKYFCSIFNFLFFANSTIQLLDEILSGLKICFPLVNNTLTS